MSDVNPESLLAYDRSHVLHPLFHPSDQEDPVLLVRGEGSTLYDASGKAYLDGLAGLWNVAVGHGRRELAEAAARQMETLAFANGYTGYTNVPAIRLAERILSLAYPNMSAVFFANSGSEAVELAVKTARFFWFASGRPEKVKIVVRKEAYHGGTIAATAATGMPAFHRGFGPLAEGFVRAETCYPYRCQWCSGEEACTLACADDIEAAIQREGPETVAAVLAEPVHGAGGVIPPTPGYWPRLREICDRHDVLLIADEVITGFGRTGRWFALDHWGVRPDMVTFAKAVTSAYVPLSGLILSERVHRTFLSLPPDLKFMHGYTNSAHPTACAVGLCNLEIMEREGLVQRAEAMGQRLRAGLEALRSEPHVGDVRGLGLMCAVELVADKASRQPFDPALGLGPRIFRMMRERGLLTRMKGESILLAPPLVITEAEIDRIVEIVGGVVRDVASAVASRA